MHLYTLMVGIVLFPQAHTLNCFTCLNDSTTCPQIQCPEETNECVAFRLITYSGNSKIADIMSKSCIRPQECFNGSVNLGLTKTIVTSECCNSNLCNKNIAPEPPKTKPNGKKCYGCDGQADCHDTLNCEGDEDFCIKASVTFGGKTNTVQGCATKSVCSAGGKAKVLSGLVTVSCCEGNYCNGADATNSSLLLLPMMLFSIFFFSN